MAYVLVAPDKFKGSLTARQAADAIARGLAKACPEISVRRVPVADGGEGTVDAALAAGYQPVTVPVRGPTGEPVTATIATRGDQAVVEAAAAGGLSLLPGGILAPLAASSFGVGELLLAALDRGCRTVLLGVGGTASTDGGAGMVAALGARLLDRAGSPLSAGGGALADLAEVDLSTMDTRLADVDVQLACDVDHRLLGDHGAAAVFGPQKGADPDQVTRLDRGLTRWAELISKATDTDLAGSPGAGAGGGLGFAALAVLNALARPGVELLLQLTGFAEQLAGARLVITGEGALDEQTLHGKAPVGVASAARAAGAPVIAVAGRCELTADQLAAAGFAAGYSLAELEPDPALSMANAEWLLERLAAKIGRDWLEVSG
ncbi:MAG TPA: glycerate kinase [Pseudonocardiaceae bacterium]|nr:glycerate kinase [Pseudonocardiaceae bacterium]